MRVPLLSKRQIDEAKAKDKALEVAEGLKLTRRVDGLRQLASETEAGYENYRIQTLEEIQKEIDSKIAERDTIAEDIRKRKIEWNNLLEPLNKNWKRFVEGEKAAIESLKAEWERRNADSILKAKEYEKLSNETIVLGEQFITGQKDNASTSDRLRKLELEAKEVVATARNTAQALTFQAELLHTEAKEHHENAVLEEQNVLLQKQALETREKAVSDREMKVLVKELELYSPIKKV